MSGCLSYPCQFRNVIRPHSDSVSFIMLSLSFSLSLTVSLFLPLSLSVSLFLHFSLHLFLCPPVYISLSFHFFQQTTQAASIKSEKHHNCSYNYNNFESIVISKH